MTRLPKISIITPSYNQARFIEQTILSVIGQQYPNIEYIIMDGGSTDHTTEIIKKYDDKIVYWCSQKDKGQSDAINQGFRRATGDILAWLNSDDYYMPATLQYIASRLNLDKPELIFGNCFHFQDNHSKAYGSHVSENHQFYNIKYYDYLIQPSVFFTRKAWEITGELNPDYHFVFDWEWFIRAQDKNVTFIPDNQYLSAYRIHDAHKSGTGGQKRIAEILRIYEQYLPADFVQTANQYLNYKDTIKNIQKIRIGRIRNKILKLKYPSIFNKYPNDQIYGMMNMLE